MTQLRPGMMIGPSYRVERELESGSTGTVYRAMDIGLERPVAVKLLQSWADRYQDRLRAEAVALASLRNDHIVGVYALGEYEGSAFIAMEFVHGRSLGELINDFYAQHSTPIPVFHGIQLLRDLADGLSAVHGAGIVHRDVKPDNVIIEHRTGRVVLVDFGAAASEQAKHDGAVMGTPMYLSPEAAAGKPPAASMDVYSLGCLAYELLCGRAPFVAPDIYEILELHRTAPPPPISSFRPDLAPLDDVLLRSIAKDPAQRLPSASVFANLLEERQAEMTYVPDDDDSVSVVLDRAEGGVRILVVDDDPMFARLAARAARMAMIETTAQIARASTGAKALASVRRRRPDIIILDYNLPDMDGVEVLSRIRAGTAGEHPDVIVASGAMGVAEQWRFGILGVEHFLPKPIEFTELLSLVHRLAQGRGWM